MFLVVAGLVTPEFIKQLTKTFDCDLYAPNAMVCHTASRVGDIARELCKVGAMFEVKPIGIRAKLMPAEGSVVY